MISLENIYLRTIDPTHLVGVTVVVSTLGGVDLVLRVVSRHGDEIEIGITGTAHVMEIHLKTYSLPEQVIVLEDGRTE